MTWDVSEHDAHLLGDQGPWVHHLATAWRACAGLSIGPLPELIGTAQRGSGATDSHEDWIGYWAPLFHLTSFGLGWTRVDLGLARWLEAGRPDDDPVLAVIDRWWGARVVDVLGWAAETQGLRDLGEQYAKKGPYLRFDNSQFHTDTRSDGDGRDCTGWSGGDPLHLDPHVWTPLEMEECIQKPSPGSVAFSRLSGDRAVIIADTYGGWYGGLREFGEDRQKNGRSVHTDVFVKPVGWLGTYRRSAVTGGYFRGRHRYHVMGA